MKNPIGNPSERSKIWEEFKDYGGTKKPKSKYQGSKFSGNDKNPSLKPLDPERERDREREIESVSFSSPTL